MMKSDKEHLYDAIRNTLRIFDERRLDNDKTVEILHDLQVAAQRVKSKIFTNDIILDNHALDKNELSIKINNNHWNYYFVTYDSNDPRTNYRLDRINRKDLNRNIQLEHQQKYPEKVFDRIICVSACRVDNVVFAGATILKYCFHQFEHVECNQHLASFQEVFKNPLDGLKKESLRRMVVLRDFHDKYSGLKDLGMILPYEHESNNKIMELISKELPSWMNYKLSERQKFFSNEKGK